MKKIICALLLACALTFNNSYSIVNNKEKVKNVKVYDKLNYKSLTKKYAKENNLEWRILYSIFIHESNLNEKAIGDSGKAIGLGQVHVASAKHHYDINVTKKQLLNPENNIKASSLILRNYLDRYNGDYIYAVAAYNIGPNNIDNAYKHKLKPLNILYVSKILTTACELNE